MRVMVIIKADKDSEAGVMPGEGLLTAMTDYNEQLVSAGIMLGGVGLVLPGILRFATFLTPVAAAGLVIIMVGATVLTVATAGVVGLFPAVVGLVALYIAVRRSRQTLA